MGQPAAGLVSGSAEGSGSKPASASVGDQLPQGTFFFLLSRNRGRQVIPESFERPEQMTIEGDWIHLDASSPHNCFSARVLSISRAGEFYKLELELTSEAIGNGEGPRRLRGLLRMTDTQLELAISDVGYDFPRDFEGKEDFQASTVWSRSRNEWKSSLLKVLETLQPGELRGTARSGSAPWVGQLILVNMLDPDRRLETTIEEDGSFQIPNVPPGPYLVSGRVEGQPELHPDFLSPKEEVVIPPGEVMELTLGEGPAVDAPKSAEGDGAAPGWEDRMRGDAAKPAEPGPAKID